MSAHRYVIIACINYTIAFTNIGFGAAQVTDHLNPSPNLLQFPSRPEEVKIQGNKAITLQQALELARRNNLELQGVLFQVERSRAAFREVEAGIYPAISLSADLSRTQSAFSQLFTEQQAQFSSTQKLSQDEPTTTFNGSVQLSYGLYNFGPGASSRGAAQEQVRLDELEVERQSEEIRLNVTLDYYNLQQADEQVRINSSAVQNSEASLRDAEALERAGVGTRFDVLRSQVNLANAQQDLTNARSQQQIARRQLATRLSLAQSVNISASDPVQLAGLWQLTVEETILLAFQNRPELKQRLVERRIAQFRQKVALSRLKPQVSFVSSYNLQDVFDDRASVLNSYSLGVQGSLRVFDGGTAKAQAAQRNIEIRIAETQFANQRNNIRFEVEQAYSQLQSNLDNVATSTVALNQAREALNFARLRFQAGVDTQTEVINTENDLTRAEGNRVQAILDYNRALAQLQRSVTSRGIR
ncbi:TolC family protein [Nostoc sp. JL33]|uniref:TolC family protein n=1 Tax=Nostoc sp. JL33 TaxID=2815396 RepID=UPI00341768D2|nr:TolC family protein [Nostoc sp. JL33]